MTALRAPVLDANGVPISNASSVADSQYYHTDNEMVSLEVDADGNEIENENGESNGDFSEHRGNIRFDPSKKMRLRAPPASSIRGWWRWAWTTLRVPDSTVFRIYGIDVWSYLQFMKFCIAVFFVLSIGAYYDQFEVPILTLKSRFTISVLKDTIYHIEMLTFIYLYRSMHFIY